MTITTAQTAIASLIEMAQRGEIDPWDVQVIEVIDHFLAELGLEKETFSQQANLPQSGQAFLWASMLVRFKADTLERLEIQDTEEVLLESELEEGENPLRRLPLELEHHIRRRSSAPPTPRRRVTLDELIAQLQQIAQEIEKIPPVSSGKRSSSQSRKETVRLITELAHQENLTELASQLEEFLTLNLSAQANYLDLEELLQRWTRGTKNQIQPTVSDRVGVFWALLLLSSQSKVELSQQEFYQDLKIELLREEILVVAPSA